MFKRTQISIIKLSQISSTKKAHAPKARGAALVFGVCIVTKSTKDSSMN